MLHFISYNPWIIIVVIVLSIFDGVMKMICLWKSAHKNQLAWFVCLGIFNTIGILPLIYLLVFDKKPITETTA